MEKCGGGDTLLEYRTVLVEGYVAACPVGSSSESFPENLDDASGRFAEVACTN